eukprot:gene6562-9019_t
MGCCASKIIVHAYYEPSKGKLIQFNPPLNHNGGVELRFVSSHDKYIFQPGDDCYLILAAWLSAWLEFAMGKSKFVPGEINNYLLVDANKEHVVSSVRTKKDYRTIKKEVWEYLFERYGGGPAIYLKVPGGLEQDSYRAGSWIRSVSLPNVAKIIIPCQNPTKESEEIIHNPMKYPLSGSENAASLAANLLLHDLSNSKMKEAKKLDGEINQAAAEAAANIFAGNLANKKYEEAKAAEAKALVAQQEQVGQLFASMGAKKRFRAALANNNMKEAKEAAAIMLQGVWRAKVSRRKMLEQKKKRQRLMEESMARKLQSAYRARLAYRRVRELKARKQLLMEESAAIRVQSRWRIKCAKEKVAGAKEERERLALLEKQRLEQQRIKEEKARPIIANIGLKFIAKLRYYKKLRLHPHMIIVTLKSASDLNVADLNGASDPYGLIHVIEGEHHAIPKHAVTPLPPGTMVPSNTLSLYKSKVITKNLSPVWNEECLTVGVTGEDNIGITLMDKDTFNQDDFLGQTIVQLSHYPQLYKGKRVDLTIPVNSFSVHIHDVHAKEVKLNLAEETPGKGLVTLSLRTAPLHTSHYGWMMKEAGSLIGFGPMQFKVRFFTLFDRKLSYYDDSHALDHPRGVIEFDHVTQIVYAPDKNNDMTLEITFNKKELWHIKFLQNETNYNIDGWMRKLQNSCNKGVVIQGVALRSGRTDSVSSLASSVHNNNGVALSNKKTTSKRMSVFK